MRTVYALHGDLKKIRQRFGLSHRKAVMIHLKSADELLRRVKAFIRSLPKSRRKIERRSRRVRNGISGVFVSGKYPPKPYPDRFKHVFPDVKDRFITAEQRAQIGEPCDRTDG